MVAHKLVLEAGIVVEHIKQKVPAYIDTAVVWLDKTADELDAKYGRPYPCTQNILCARTHRRHKTNCIGRVEKFDTWARALI